MSKYDVHTRYDGAAAVAAAEALRPHLILLDLGMPVLNGYEACQKIRSEPWGEGVVIVAVTGWGPESEMPAVEDCGFNAHVVKPVKPGELVQLLTNLLQEGPES
jgi:CheY-like chemotaxis protein